jgi:putative exporter of polyketide antibiotics
MRLIGQREQRAHPFLAIVGATLTLSMSTVIVASGFFSQSVPRPVRMVVVVFMLIGAVCVLLGSIPKRGARELQP